MKTQNFLNVTIPQLEEMVLSDRKFVTKKKKRLLYYFFKLKYGIIEGYQIHQKRRFKSCSNKMLSK